MSQYNGLSLIHKLCAITILVAGLLAVNLGAGASKASACPTCFSESATAYTYCHNNPGGTYAGCNFTHVCHAGESANSIYREECLLSH
jgi:hypothetical protein